LLALSNVIVMYCGAVFMFLVLGIC
jgi:hypothetical protein